jgi:hypothetical protein
MGVDRSWGSPLQSGKLLARREVELAKTPIPKRAEYLFASMVGDEDVQ